MSIEKRKNYINQLAKRFACEKITDLMLEVKLPDELFENISIATKTYISKCMDSNSVFLDEKELIKELVVSDILARDQSQSTENYLKELRKEYEVEIFSDINAQSN